MVSGQQHAPAALYPRERPGTHCTGGWVGHRAGLDGRKISSPPGFDPTAYIYTHTYYKRSPSYNSVDVIFTRNSTASLAIRSTYEISVHPFAHRVALGRYHKVTEAAMPTETKVPQYCFVAATATWRDFQQPRASSRTGQSHCTRHL